MRHQAITWAIVDPDLCRHIASLGYNKLISVREMIYWRMCVKGAIVGSRPNSWDSCLTDLVRRRLTAWHAPIIPNYWIGNNDDASNTLHYGSICLWRISSGLASRYFVCHFEWSLIAHSWFEIICRWHFKDSFSAEAWAFRFKLHWSLCPRVQLKICQYGFRQWLGAEQATNNSPIQCQPKYIAIRRHYTCVLQHH